MAHLSGRGLLNYPQGFLAQKKFPEAIAEYEKLRKIMGDSPFVLGDLGNAYARASRTAEALQILDKLKTNSAGGGSQSGAIVAVYLGLGDLDQAWVWLERQVESRDTDPRLFKIYPLGRDLDKDPRYAALLKKYGLDK